MSVTSALPGPVQNVYAFTETNDLYKRQLASTTAFVGELDRVLLRGAARLGEYVANVKRVHEELRITAQPSRPRRSSRPISASS